MLIYKIIMIDKNVTLKRIIESRQKMGKAMK